MALSILNKVERMQTEVCGETFLSKNRIFPKLFFNFTKTFPIGGNFQVVIFVFFEYSASFFFFEYIYMSADSKFIVLTFV